MSIETVQFIEMVRQAAVASRLHYCPKCGCETPHSITVAGLQEIFTCFRCRNQTPYTVR